MNNTIEPTREFVALELMHDWEDNPRGGVLRGMPEFIEQIRRDGGIHEDVHLFRDRMGRLVSMQGHRRRAAAKVLGYSGLWAQIYDFTEEDAFRHLMTLQNGVDPFSPVEQAKGARTALRLGIPKEELPGLFHRQMEQIELYLAIDKLPVKAQQMVDDGTLCLEGVGLMARLTPEQQREAMGQLVNPVTKEPYSAKVLKEHFEAKFFKPARDAAKWEKMKKKTHLEVIENNTEKPALVQVVEWAERETYVYEGVLPQDGYKLAMDWLRPEEMAEGLEIVRWWDIAAKYGVPVMLAPAMDRGGEPWLLVVNEKLVVDTDSLAVLPMLRRNGKRRRAEGNGGAAVGGGNAVAEGADERNGSDAKDGDDQSAVRPAPCALHSSLDLGRWKAVAAKLMQRPEAAMQDKLWKPVILHAWECASATLSAEDYADCMGIMNSDEIESRRGLRWVLLGVLACAMAQGEAEALVEIESALGIE